MEEEKWHQLQRTQGDSKFTKNLAVMIWGTETLKNRSVTGVATKKKKDALPKPPLSPSKLKIVRGKISFGFTPGGGLLSAGKCWKASDLYRHTAFESFSS